MGMQEKEIDFPRVEDDLHHIFSSERLDKSLSKLMTQTFENNTLRK